MIFKKDNKEVANKEEIKEINLKKAEVKKDKDKKEKKLLSKDNLKDAVEAVTHVLDNIF